MAELSVQQVSLTGLSATYTAAATAGDDFLNSGKSILHVMNADSASTTVTVNSIENCNQGYDHNVVVAVPAGSEIFIGPFNRARFNGADGKADITYSSVADLTVAVVEVP
jgi:hypothetical protein